MNFEIFETIQGNGKTCRSCEHRQRHEKNSKIIQYCAAQKSGRTENGLMKIKASDPACPKYQGMHLPTGEISYHLPASMWEMLDMCGIATSLRGPAWDGHTAVDTVKRLAAWCVPNAKLTGRGP